MMSVLTSTQAKQQPLEFTAAARDKSAK